MKKESQIKIFALGIVIFFCIAFCATGFLIGYNSYPQQEQTPTAILNTEVYDWYFNIDDNSETAIEYWIYNYGEVEAKNVKVKCGLYDGNHNLLKVVTDYVGNVASQSYSFQIAIMKNPFGYGLGDSSTVGCVVSDCEQCEFLYERIPELVEGIEEGGLR